MQINQVSINMVHYLYQHRFSRKHRESVKVEEQQWPSFVRDVDRCASSTLSSIPVILKISYAVI